MEPLTNIVPFWVLWFEIKRYYKRNTIESSGCYCLPAWRMPGKKATPAKPTFFWKELWCGTRLIPQILSILCSAASSNMRILVSKSWPVWFEHQPLLSVWTAWSLGETEAAPAAAAHDLRRELRPFAARGWQDGVLVATHTWSGEAEGSKTIQTRINRK